MATRHEQSIDSLSAKVKSTFSHFLSTRLNRNCNRRERNSEGDKANKSNEHKSTILLEPLPHKSNKKGNDKVSESVYLLFLSREYYFTYCLRLFQVIQPGTKPSFQLWNLLITIVPWAAITGNIVLPLQFL